MPRLLVCLAAVVAVLTGCSPKETTPEVRWRFLGGQVLLIQTNAPTLREILNLPQASAIADPLARNLARAWWSLGAGEAEPTPEALGAGAELTRDLLQQLSIGEMVTRTGGGREFALAIQVPPDRLSVWEKSWPAWINSLRSVRGDSGAGAPSVTRHDVWLLAVSDSSLLPPDATLLRLAAYQPVAGALLQFETSIPGIPAAQVAFTTTNGNVRATATVIPLKPLPTTFPDWSIPTFIREPLIQFTAIRGLNSVTEGWFEANPWTGGAWPNQIFIWGQPSTTWRFPFLAAQVDDPAAVLDHWFKRLQLSFAPASPSPLYQGRLLQTTNQVIIAGGIPVAPVLQATEREEKPFVTLSFVPRVATTNPPAPEMVAQMSRSNILLYDLEFTSDAIKQWNAALQLPDLLEGRQGVMNYPATLWLLAAGPKLGECVTTVTIDGPQKLQVQRKSPVGLSGLELTALAKWLDPQPPLRRRLTNSPVRPKP